jgi:DNA mismatch endonuclease (patch repair protein)
MMARIRSTDTKPEMILRRGLHAAGFRYRLHVPGLPGKPDIVLPKFRSVIFVHGCFWHGHADCKNFRIPKTRPEFWTAKINTNRDRDNRTIAAIRDAGWRVLVVWECATRSICVDNLVRIVAAWLQGAETSAELGANGLACPGEFKPRIVGKQEV